MPSKDTTTAQLASHDALSILYYFIFGSSIGSQGGPNRRVHAPSDGGWNRRRKEPAISLGRRARIISPSSLSFGHHTKLTHTLAGNPWPKKKTHRALRLGLSRSCPYLFPETATSGGYTAATESNTHTLKINVLSIIRRPQNIFGC